MNIIGKTIKKVRFVEDGIIWFTFTDGTHVRIDGKFSYQELTPDIAYSFGLISAEEYLKFDKERQAKRLEAKKQQYEELKKELGL